MIRFDQGNRRFNYRIAGVAIHDGAVLLHRAGEEPFWTVPGGRAEHGETAEATIRREMREELATDVDVVRLLWFVENFFDYEGVHYHELALYFLIRFPSGSAPVSVEAFEREDAGTRLRFKWVPVLREALAGLPLMPPFLPEALTDLPATLVHLVHHDTAQAEACALRFRVDGYGSP